MSIGYIRQHYSVPAKVGGKVRFMGKDGVIVGAWGAYLRVRLRDGIANLHPTWGVEYLQEQEGEG